MILWLFVYLFHGPPYQGERKVTAPIELQEIRYFTVECFFIIWIDLYASFLIFRSLNEDFETIKNVGKLSKILFENCWYCFTYMVFILGWDEEVKLVEHWTQDFMERSMDCWRWKICLLRFTCRGRFKNGATYL